MIMKLASSLPYSEFVIELRALSRSFDINVKLHKRTAKDSLGQIVIPHLE